MITNKDLSIDSENGKITLNGNKYDLGTQGEIDTAVKDVYSVMGQMGAKNLINYPYYDLSGKTNKGITYTYDKDGIITANGSTDANNQSYMTLDDFSRGLVLPSTKKYTLTCEKTNDNNKGFAVLYFKNADNTSKTVSVHAEYEDGTTRNANSDYVSLLYNNVVHTSVTFWVDTDTIYITQARFSTNSGTITNAVLKPMLRLASDTDNTYEPYAMTNKQLTEQVADVKGTIGDLTQTGVAGATVAAQIGTLNNAIGGLHYAVFSKPLTSVAVDTAWGNMYESSLIYIDITSLGLTTAPMAVFLGVVDAGSSVIFELSSTTKDAINFRLTRPTSVTIPSVTVTALVIY